MCNGTDITVTAQMSAAKEGFQQILWLFGQDHEVTEVGTVRLDKWVYSIYSTNTFFNQMNLFLVIADEEGQWELVTPALGDTILPGVTRDSVLALAREHVDPHATLKIEGIPKIKKVSERRVTMSDIIALQKQGRLIEMFGSGTAVVISPIREIGYNGDKIPVPVGEDGLGDVARAMLREVVGRQRGGIESEWTVVVD